jgi:hypothetical protein
MARMGDGRDAYRVLVGRHEGKRPRSIWKDNIVFNFYFIQKQLMHSF